MYQRWYLYGHPHQSHERPSEKNIWTTRFPTLLWLRTEFKRAIAYHKILVLIYRMVIIKSELAASFIWDILFGTTLHNNKCYQCNWLNGILLALYTHRSQYHILQQIVFQVLKTFVRQYNMNMCSNALITSVYTTEYFNAFVDHSWQPERQTFGSMFC